MKNKIAIIDHVGIKSGMDFYTGSLAKGFTDNGFACSVFSNFDFEGDNISTYQFFESHNDNRILKGLNFFSGFIKSGFFAKKNNHKNVIVHIFSYQLKDVIAYFILKIIGLDITGIVHDVENLSNDKDTFRRLILNKWCKKLIVQNKFSFDALCINEYEHLKTKTTIIPHGNFHSLPSNISKEEARKKLNLALDKKYILFFGQIKEVKGLEILLQAMPMIGNTINLVIAGKPWKNDLSKYDKIITDNNLQHRIISMYRFIDNDERDLLFSATDVNVIPYKKIFQSGVLLMALSYKLPVIASRLLPFQEFLEDKKDVLFFENENVTDLSNKINLHFNNENDAQLRAENAWQKTKINNDWMEISKKMISWIEN
ncbi:MAG: glycosyltransferase family 4 protein [Chitinophagaceae bacterium]|nr:glycosyltransferase family 4 protein [Chitinophagaceae bacterium]